MVLSLPFATDGLMPNQWAFIAGAVLGGGFGILAGQWLAWLFLFPAYRRHVSRETNESPGQVAGGFVTRSDGGRIADCRS